MRISENGIKLIAEFEGYAAQPYQDAVGVWSIGYGTTYLPGGKRVDATTPPVTPEQAAELLRYGLQHVEKRLNDLVACGLQLTQNQYDALCAFAYNVGIKKLESGTTMGDALAAKDLKKVGEAFGIYTLAGGKMLQGLVRRRTAESNLFLT